MVRVGPYAPASAGAMGSSPHPFIPKDSILQYETEAGTPFGGLSLWVAPDGEVG